jgi:putative NIF3 family GTP cyclohydrolase 1 type 2
MSAPLSIQDVIDTIVAAMSEAPLTETVDTVKTGDPSRPVAGVVTTFLATTAVIAEAIRLRANLIITHEPTFYSHTDDVDWLQGDPVYAAKRRLLDENGIVVWRLHDRIHFAHRPDGIIAGMLEALGWQAYADADHASTATIPLASLRDLVAHLKERLRVPNVRVVGPPDLICRRVGLLVGAAPGEWHIRAFREQGLDVVICGESREWETCEYVRDANTTGRPAALVSLGHAASEEPGMQWVATWLRERLPTVPITHIPAGDPFTTM